MSAGRRIKRWQLAFTRLANLCYGGFMVCFPVLLVVTPEVSAMWHSLLFFCMILVSFTVVAANFAEAHKVKVESKLWLAAFGAHSVLLSSSASSILRTLTRRKSRRRCRGS